MKSERCTTDSIAGSELDQPPVAKAPCHRSPQPPCHLEMATLTIELVIEMLNLIRAREMKQAEMLWHVPPPPGPLPCQTVLMAAWPPRSQDAAAISFFLSKLMAS